jgi:DNA modification methylase
MKVLDQAEGPGWMLYHSDTVEVARGLPDKSVHFSIFSPPFASLFTYSASNRDFGNVKSYGQFFEGYAHLVREQVRVMMPGRLVAVHCMDLPSSKANDGYIGLKDLPGDLIRAYQAEGFIYHSRITIWKNPVVAMQRTKALGLLHKQLKKDSAMSRQGIADYVVVMRAPGGNPAPIAHTADGFPVALWQRYASPCWVTTRGEEDGFAVCRDPDGAGTAIDGDLSEGIDQGETLNVRSARESDDERHLCPLQLSVIRRCVRLWSNPRDTVWTPFAGVGSEVVVALEEGRRAIGAELKRSYYRTAVRNAMGVGKQQSMFKE